MGVKPEKTYELLRAGTQGVSNAGKRPKIMKAWILPWNIEKNGLLWFQVRTDRISVLFVKDQQKQKRRKDH